MVELDCKHTGQNIKNIVINVLERCGLNIDNVYSCTTDNGANMLKARYTVDGKYPVDEDDNDGDDDNDVDDDDDDFENGLEELVSVIARCVAHIIQLVAFDVTKMYKKNIKAIRKFVIK